MTPQHCDSSCKCFGGKIAGTRLYSCKSELNSSGTVTDRERRVISNFGCGIARARERYDACAKQQGKAWKQIGDLESEKLRLLDVITGRTTG